MILLLDFDFHSNPKNQSYFYQAKSFLNYLNLVELKMDYCDQKYYMRTNILMNSDWINQAQLTYCPKSYMFNNGAIRQIQFF